MVGSLGQIAVCQPSLCLVTEGVELGTNIREDYTFMENGHLEIHPCVASVRTNQRPRLSA